MSGRKFDADKDRWDLLPFNVIQWVVKVLTFGAAKYEPNNWQLVDNGIERYFASLMRHVVAWRSGQWLDDESKLPHLGHAMCCLMFIFWLELKGHKHEKL